MPQNTGIFTGVMKINSSTIVEVEFTVMMPAPHWSTPRLLQMARTRGPPLRLRCVPTYVVAWNSVIWNGIGTNWENGGAFTATYSNIEGGWTGMGNISADPLFIGAPHTVYILMPDLLIHEHTCVQTSAHF